MRVLLIALAYTSALQAATTTVTLEPVADTYVRKQDPLKNYGASALLEVSGENEQVAMFRFDISQIPAAAVVSSVRLKLTFDAPKEQLMDSKFMACDLNRDFSETEANYKDFAAKNAWSAPGLTKYQDFASADGSYCSPVMHLRGPGQSSGDLTDFLRMSVDAHRKVVNVALVALKDSYRGAGVYSRRSAQADRRPKLVITFDAAIPKAVTNHPFPETKFGPVMLDGSDSTKPDGNKTGLQYLWTVERAAPASTYSSGQELGREAKLKFEPDVPGFWDVRLRVTDPVTKGYSERVVTVTDLRIGAHPRLGFNDELLTKLKALRTSNSPEWARFADWLARPGDPAYGKLGEALLFGYVTTKNKALFDAAWKIYVSNFYVNGIDRSKGLKAFFIHCGAAVYCEDHGAGATGGYLTFEVALLYDWGYDALLPAQRADLAEWLKSAVDYNYLHNSLGHSHFRNDGVSVTEGLGAAAYALYGDSREAPALMTMFRHEWEHTLQAMDVLAAGGALGEGNAYGETTGEALINLANMVYYASGENLFYSHPYFRRHLAYEAFSTYPSRLGEANDPIAHSDPPHPYPEGAALGGDDNRGFSWHSLHLRPNGLALTRQFPNTEEAEIWNWVFRQKDEDQPWDPWTELYYYSPPPALVKPKRLSFFDSSLGYVYVRSDWDSRDATWIASWAGPHADLHQHLDQGSFTLFKRRDLAAKTGNYDYDPTKPHFMTYYTRTVSANNLLIGDPNEYFGTFIGYWGCDGLSQHDLFPMPDGSGRVCLPNDGGQRTMAPYSLVIFDNDDYYAHRDIYDVAKVTGFADNGQAVAWVADITNAYNNPRYTTPNNHPKVTKVYRKYLYLRQPDILMVADTVDTTDPGFEKSWLIHSVDRIEVGGTARQVDPGESIITGTDTARIVVDDKNPSNTGQISADGRTGYAALQLKTLFPEKFRYDLIGGRQAAKTSHMQQGQPNPAVLEGGGAGLHPHRHIKDFWVKDYSEGVQPDHRSLNWPPVYPQEVSMQMKGATFIGGYGRWRLEVQPTTPAKNNYFLNVLKPTLETTNNMPEISKFETADTFGATFTSGGKNYKVSFSKETTDLPSVEGMDLQAPVISNAKPANVLPANTRQTVVSVTTDEPASCKFSYRAGITFPFMTGVFQSSDGLTHTATNRELSNGDSYTYFVRCQDKAGNQNLSDLKLTFSVAH
jgi:hypothetical protein